MLLLPLLLQFATEAAITILRIDDLIRLEPAAADEGEEWPVGWRQQQQRQQRHLTGMCDSVSMCVLVFPLGVSK